MVYFGLMFDNLGFDIAPALNFTKKLEFPIKKLGEVVLNEYISKENCVPDMILKFVIVLVTESTCEYPVFNAANIKIARMIL